MSELFGNLRKFNIARHGRKPSILGGVKRKALLAMYTQCSECGMVWIDKVYKVPHIPTCPDGHKQRVSEDSDEYHVIWSEEELGCLKEYALAKDIAAAGELGVREGFSKETITAEQFFAQYGFDTNGRPVKRNPRDSYS